MGARRWALRAGLLALTVAPLTTDGVSAVAYAGWPAMGFSTALFLVCGRRQWRTTLAVQTVAVAAGVAIGYGLAPWAALPASLVVTAPSLLCAVLLRWGDDHPEVRLDVSDSDRFYLVTSVSAAACAALGAVGVVLTGRPDEAAMAAVMSFLGALSALMIVLPLVVGQSQVPAVAGRVELWCLRAVALLVAVPALWFGTDGLLLFVLPTLLGWAARRATPREAHLHLLLICLVAYGSGLADRGPLAHAPLGLPDAWAPAVFYLFALCSAYLVVPMTLAMEEMVTLTSRAQRSATTLERLFDAAAGTVLVATDETGLITHFNSGAERALGYAAREVIGSRPSRLYSHEELTRQAERLGVPATTRDVVRTVVERGQHRDWVFTRKDGSERTLSLSISAVRDGEGHTVGMVISGEDISERLRAEQALASALERELASLRSLQRVDQVKQDLVSTVSHELRTPITSIAGYTELLVDGMLGPLTQEQTDALDRIERNTGRLGALVEDLLTTAKAEAGQLDLVRTRLDLRDLAREAFETLRELTRTRDLEVRLCLPQEPVPLDGDRVALARVVENLVTNAVKFTPDGGSVLLAVRREEDRCCLVVTDTGLGIPEEDRPHLFTRFFRSQSAADHAIQGSGLGLSIAHAIVSRHDGELDVTSAPGQGTTFTVRLPSGSGPVERVA